MSRKKSRIKGAWERRLEESETCQIIVHSKTYGTFVARTIHRKRVRGMTPEKDLEHWERDVKAAERGARKALDSKWEANKEFENVEVRLI